MDTKNVTGILLGTLAGAVAGVLLAPDKGENTRKKIKEEALSAKEKIKETTSEFSNTVAETTSNFREKAGDTYVAKKESFDKELENVMSNVSYKVEEVIKTLERKLNELKLKNKKLQKQTGHSHVNGNSVIEKA